MHNNYAVPLWGIWFVLSFIGGSLYGNLNGIRDELRRTSNICIGSAAVPSSLTEPN